MQGIKSYRLACAYKVDRSSGHVFWECGRSPPSLMGSRGYTSRSRKVILEPLNPLRVYISTNT